MTTLELSSKSRILVFISFICQSRLILLTILSLMTLVIYFPFFANAALGGNDAQWYYGVLNDVLTQYKNAIFPVYVGQTIFSYAGSPAVAMAPSFVLLGGLINLITLSKFDTFQIQHLIVLVSMVSSAFSMFFVLNKLVKNKLGMAFLFTFFYITCPAVITPISHFDAYRAVITLPFTPILFYGLIRTYQQNNLISSLIVAISLAFIWLAHPPIGFWAGIICAFFWGVMLLTLKKGFRSIFISGFIFFGLALWQFVFTLSTHLNVNYNPKFDNYADLVVMQLRQLLPGILLPVNWSSEFMAPLQPGFTIWFLLGLSFYTYFKLKEGLLKNLVICLTLFLVLILPVPFITHFIYQHLPRVVQDMTVQWPMERLCFLFIPLAIITGYLSLIKMADNQNQKRIYRNILIALTILSIWNILEVRKFTEVMFKSISIHDSKIWQLPENYRFIPGYGGIRSNQPEGTHDPILENRVLDHSLKPVTKLSNEAAILSACKDSQNLHVSFIERIKQSKEIPLMQFKILPEKKYAMCLDISSQYCPGIFHVRGINHDSWLCNLLGNKADYQKQNIVTHQTIILPVYTTEPMQKSMSASFTAYPQVDTPAFAQFKSFKLVEYHDAMLPVKVESIFPYVATVTTESDQSYLETHRYYIPGYKAWVNNHETEILKSPDETVMIPLQKGRNHVVLKYTATTEVRLAYYVSLTSWTIALLLLIILSRNTRKQI